MTSVQADRSNLLIRSLQQPGLWGPGTGRVEVIETHISWVLLTGPYAYKIKKPVDFGFVDFTTLDRREFYCREELRLNRRLAPALYLDVIAITGSPEQPVIEGAGEPIEFAVKMRQFPQEALLSRLLEDGRLRVEHVDRLAGKVADFHGRVAVAAADSPFGTPGRLLAPALENFRHLAAANLSESQHRQLSRLEEWTRQEFAARRADFLDRKRDGFVRECHGDMHLGNVILWESEPHRPEAASAPEQTGKPAAGEVLIFDCIEFNESFRWIDVLSEAAFLVMDLQDRGRPDFAYRLLNDYLQHTGDYPGLAVLRFYLAYRALVRAKVDSLRADQADVPDEQKRRLGRELQTYLDLAASYTRPPHPCLVIAHGLSGSGKTFGTQSLLEQLGAVRVRSDVERKRLWPRSGAGARGEAGVSQREQPARRAMDRGSSEIAGGMYSPEMTRITYKRLAECAEAIVRAGFPAIVDATFLKRAQRDAFRALADRLGARFLILDFQATEETLRRRIAGRATEGRDASEADVQVLEYQLENREPLDDQEERNTLRIGQDRPAAGRQLAVAVEERLSRQPPDGRR